MQAMADWYTKSDIKGDQVEQQTKLSRILDVAQDLKVRSVKYMIKFDEFLSFDAS